MNIIGVYEEEILISVVCPFGIICVILLLPFLILIVPIITLLSVFSFFISTFGTLIGFLLFSALAFAIIFTLYKLFRFIQAGQSICSEQNDDIFNKYILPKDL